MSEKNPPKDNTSQLAHDQLLVQVVDKNFQTNIEGQGQQKLGNNEFLDNSDQEEYNNKPATPHQPQKSEQVFEKSSQQNDDQSQVEEEQNYFKLSQILPKQNQKQRLIEQNIKLKAQIYELAKQLDEILQKDRNRKKKFGIGLNVIDQEDELIRQRKLQLKKQQIQIMQVKNRIFVMKRQLDSVYNNVVVTDRQNHIKKLEAQLREVERERDGLVNINQEQVKALKVAENQEEYGSKLNQTKQQYHQIKKQTRKMVQKIIDQEKKLKNLHGVYTGKLSTLKDIQTKLLLNKQKQKLLQKKTAKQSQMITEQMIKSLETQIKQLQIVKKEGQKSWQEKIKAIDVELYRRKIQEEKKMMVLREKQKQSKLNELKIRQLKKLIRDNQVAQKEKRNKEVDMSQYRHKRNIRYMDK